MSVRFLALAVFCGLGLSLTSCSMESFDSTTTDFGERWRIEKASEACNAQIERNRWGSVAAILSYERHEPDHGYRACMNGKLNKQRVTSANGLPKNDAAPVTDPAF